MKKIAKPTPTTDLKRREAIKTAGKYAVFTALASMVFLSPKSAQADSPTSPGWGN